jgi:hypothetical protein
MAGGVNDVDFMVAPFTISGRRGNGDTPFFFQFHGIHGSPYTILAFDVMNGMDPLGVIQNSFGQGRFTRIDVGRV